MDPISTLHPFSIDIYCEKFLAALRGAFGDRVCYVGLQGSYLRGEATAHSDIDMMVILDDLSVEDMKRYRDMLEEIGDADRACGFICSADEMRNWNPLEACQLSFTTKDLFGELAAYLPRWTIEDEKNYAKMSLNNLYHALCHGFIHASAEHMAECLLPLYKGAFFILQNTSYLAECRTNVNAAVFPLTKAALLERLQGEDRLILQTLMGMTSGGPVAPERHFTLLHSWCRNKMAQVR